MRLRLSLVIPFGLVVGLLAPATCYGDLPVVLFDDFDDGDYNGWSLTGMA